MTPRLTGVDGKAPAAIAVSVTVELLALIGASEVSTLER